MIVYKTKTWKMNFAVRSIRNTSHSQCPLQSCIQASTINHLKQLTTLSSDQKNMEKDQKSNEKSGSLMSNSFGDGYSTRSDDDGFGTCGGHTQSLPKVDSDKDIHSNHPAYDKSQGSEVKEKEDARHQSHN